MRHNVSLAIALILLFSNLNITAQTLSSIKACGLPQGFNFSTNEIDINTSFPSLNRYWVVYSDRANNFTFAGPDGNIIKDTVNFMERFFVAEAKGTFIHLYKENQSTIWPQISSSARDFGWITQDRMLLWEHCMRNTSSLIDKKAMILSTFEGVTQSRADEQAVTYMKNPMLSISSNRKSRKFEILFVYKLTRDAVLLGENFEIRGNEGDILSNMRGWVKKEEVTFWDHRITLEPNWEEAAAQERLEKGVKSAIFIDEKAALDYQKGKPVDPSFIVWDNDPGAKRNIGQWRRFPIIEFKPTGVLNTGVMGKIQNSKVIMTVERMAQINKFIEALELKTRKINVIFVVDGTESMGKFYQSIAKGIETSVNQLRVNDTQNRISFGAVIYRDFAEKDLAVESKPITENFMEIIDFFKTSRTDYNNDKDMPEAVFYGLKTALTKIGMKKGESNFIVLIGDCGNHNRNDYTQVPIDEVINLLAQYETSLIAYQVNNGSDPSFQDFVNQARLLIKGSAIEIRKIRVDDKMKWLNENANLKEPYFKATGPNRYSLNPQEIVGSYLFPGIGQSLSYEILENEITNKIEEFDNRISLMLSKAHEVVRGAGTPSVSGEADEYHPAVINFLSRIQGISAEEIELLKNKNFQFSMRGYTSKKVNGLENPVFKEVLFLSREDLQETISRLNSLCGIPGTMSTRRLKMQNVWIDILSRIIGTDKKEEIMNMTGDELHNVVFGLPSQSKFTADIKLKDIVEPTVISDTQFEQYALYLDSKLQGLQDIVSDQRYAESFVSNNITYYWLPMEVFP